MVRAPVPYESRDPNSANASCQLEIDQYMLNRLSKLTTASWIAKTMNRTPLVHMYRLEGRLDPESAKGKLKLYFEGKTENCNKRTIPPKNSKEDEADRFRSLWL